MQFRPLYLTVRKEFPRDEKYFAQTNRALSALVRHSFATKAVRFPEVKTLFSAAFPLYSPIFPTQTKVTI